MLWRDIPLIIAVFLLVNFIINCVEEAVRFHDWRDDE